VGSVVNSDHEPRGARVTCGLEPSNSADETDKGTFGQPFRQRRNENKKNVQALRVDLEAGEKGVKQGTSGSI